MVMKPTSTGTRITQSESGAISVAAAADSLTTILSLPTEHKFCQALGQPGARGPRPALTGWLQSQISADTDVIELDQVPTLISKLLDLLYGMEPAFPNPQPEGTNRRKRAHTVKEYRRGSNR